MNRRAFLLSTLIAPFAAALAPAPQYVDFGLLQKKPWAVYTPPTALRNHTTKREEAFQKLAQAAFETREADVAMVLNNFISS